MDTTLATYKHKILRYICIVCFGVLVYRRKCSLLFAVIEFLLCAVILKGQVGTG